MKIDISTITDIDASNYYIDAINCLEERKNYLNNTRPRRIVKPVNYSGMA